MTKQILHIELAGIDPNRPGSKRVAEAVGVDLAHPSPQAVTGEHDVHVMIAKGPAVYGLEEVAFAPAAVVVEVGSEGSEGLPRLSPSSAAYVPCLEGRAHGLSSHVQGTPCVTATCGTPRPTPFSLGVDLQSDRSRLGVTSLMYPRQALQVH